jgi:integrase
MAKLTKRAVDALQPGSPDYFMWDDELPGFGVRVWPSGRKVYVAQYRAGSRSRRVKIGRHGALTVEEARKQAKAVLGDVARGSDPATERATRRASLTVKELCANYLDAAERGLIIGKGNKPKKPGTLYVDRGRIARHIVPLLGSKLVRDLTSADINRFMRDVASGRTAAVEKTGLRGKAIVEGGPGTAARTVGLLGGILSFAVAEGVIPANPARGVKRPADKKRQRRLTGDEYRQLGEALAAAEADCEAWQGVTAAWLLALTGCRIGEVIGLKWAEVDDAAGCFRLSETKEGASVRPIGRPAFDVLAQIERREDCPFVLPAVRGDGAFGGMPGFWRRLAKRAELPDVTPHTLRHSFASASGDLGYTENTIAAMLGHAAGSVTSRYVHHLDAVLIAAADRVARTIYGHMTGETGKVVQMPRAKTRRKAT